MSASSEKQIKLARMPLRTQLELIELQRYQRYRVSMHFAGSNSSPYLSMWDQYHFYIKDAFVTTRNPLLPHGQRTNFITLLRKKFEDCAVCTADVTFLEQTLDAHFRYIYTRELAFKSLIVAFKRHHKQIHRPRVFNDDTMSGEDKDHKWGEATKIDYDALAENKPTLTAHDGVDEADPELERSLYGGRTSGAGDSLAALALEVTVEGANKVKPIRSFEEGGLHPVVLENIKKCQYNQTTAIQGYTIPAVLAGQDVVAVAQTGSGKTAAFLIPIISELMGKVDKIGGPRVDTRDPSYDPEKHKVRAEPLVVIVCPTRELALQIFDETRRLAYRSKLRPVCCYGGIAVKYNLQQLSKGCDILIGTPGRLMDMLERQHVLSLNRVKFTVIDEADEMLQDSDWEEALTKIMAGGDANEDADHRYLMFSATFPKAARGLARQYLQEDYVRIRVGRAGSSHKNVTQEIIWVDRDNKPQALYDLLFAMDPSRTLIFCNSVAGVERLDDYLYNRNMPTSFLHSRRTQYEREDAMRAFTLNTPILITTALSARGIDFPDVKTVINYDLPSLEHGGIDEYVHRIGRTGRIGHVGKAISFYNGGDEAMGQDLVNVLMETEQEVPDFLSDLKPEGGQVVFQDDTDDEDEGLEMATDGAGGWGDGGGAAASNQGNAPGASWGDDAGASPGAEASWGAEATPAPSAVTAW
ncbi:ATP-dependent RNA helicase DED1 [Elsinoe australis]|uniref:RNA helicase n=1 Tax=Elsinoe australis TaxID=40998 RepID=A0A2P7YFY6_9PEZI|nr:ATP-dependent RNA helicase DED1 [Elsinoe australis]